MSLEKLTESVRNEDKGKEEWIDLFLFFGLLLLSDVLFVPFMRLDSNQEYQIDWENTLPPYLYFPVLILLVTGIVILWFRRNCVVSKRPKKALLGIFAFLIVYRMIGIFAFPYGPRDYLFRYGDTDYTVLYSGFTAYNRITTFLSEIYFFVFLLFLYTYLDTFSDRFWLFFEVLLWVMVAVALIAIFYSMAAEGRDIYQTWLNFFKSHGEDASGIYRHRSFTSHRNVFGFLLMMAIFSLSILLFRHKGSAWFYLPMTFIWFYLLLVFCRTAIFLSTAVFFFTLVYQPILYFKKDRVSSFVSIGLLIAVLVYLVVEVCLTSTLETWNSIHQSFMAMMRNQGSIGGRKLHNDIAFSMFNSFFSVFFGYNRSPFVGIYQGLEEYLMSYEPLWTCHNTYEQIWLDQGLLTLIADILALMYLLFQSVRISVRKDWSNLSYTVILLMLMVYSFLEPRGLFLKEGSSVYFLILMLLPVHHTDRCVMSSSSSKLLLFDKLF